MRQSNALWPAGVCYSKWGDNISTDKHATEEQADAVCDMLKRYGFGGGRRVFPIRVGTSPIQDPPKLPEDTP